MPSKKRKVKNRKELALVASNAIRIAEVLFEGPGRGAEKKEWVVDFINEKINLPLLNENQEEKLISFLVDCLCGIINKHR